MSDTPNPTVEALKAIGQLHHKLAAEYEALACHVANSAVPTLGQLAQAAGVPVADAVVDPPAPARRRAAPAQVDPDPVPAPAATAPPAAPAARSAPPHAAVPPAAVAAQEGDVPPLPTLITAMQAHAKAKAANGGAIATLKLLKRLDKSYSTGSSVPAEKRAEVIAALNADAVA